MFSAAWSVTGRADAGRTVDSVRDEGDSYLPVQVVNGCGTVDGTGNKPLSEYTRRQFLKIAAGSTALTAAGVMTRGRLFRHARRAFALSTTAPASGPVADLTIAAERDIDLVALDFSFYGFTVRPGSPPAIVPTTAANNIVVQFPPQAIGEAVYFADGAGGFPVDKPPVLSDVAGPSRLVFSLRPDQAIPLPTMTVADLLDWSAWSLDVPAVANVDNIDRVDVAPAQPSMPGEMETRIECPYALYLSPTTFGSFSSRREPLTIDGTGFHNYVTDCWGTALTGDTRVVATYARDYLGGPVNNATAETNIDYSPQIN